MMALSRRVLLGLVVAGIAVSSAWADAAAAESQPASADPQIREPVTELYAALEKAMRAGRAAPFASRFDTLAPVIDQVFDLQTVLKVSVGLRWAGIDPAMQAALFKAFRRFTIATYVANFDNYDGQRFEITPNLRSSGANRVVQTRIITSSGDSTRLDYVMADTQSGWRVEDVLLDGTISRVAVQRSDFRGLLGAGDATALIASLRRKVADLSGGTLES